MKSATFASDTSDTLSKTNAQNITIDLRNLSPNDTITLKFENGHIVISKKDVVSQSEVQQPSPDLEPKVQELEVVQPKIEEPESPVIVDPMVQQFPYQEPPRAIVRRYQGPEWTCCDREDYDGNICRIMINIHKMECYRSDKKTLLHIPAHRFEYGDGSVAYLCHCHHQLYYKKSIVR